MMAKTQWSMQCYFLQSTAREMDCVKKVVFIIPLWNTTIKNIKFYEQSWIYSAVKKYLPIPDFFLVNDVVGFLLLFLLMFFSPMSKWRVLDYKTNV